MKLPLWQRPWFWFAVALLPRLIYLYEQSATSPLFYVPLQDAADAVEDANALLRGDGFGPGPLFKAPFYLIFLAATMVFAGDAYLWLARLIQHVAGALLAALAVDGVRRVLGHRSGVGWAAALAGALVAVYAPMVRLENRLILDFFALFFQSAMVWALLRAKLDPDRRRWVLWAGGLAALAILTRPTVLPVLPFLAAWLAGARLWKWRDRAKSRRALERAGVFLAFPAMALVLTMARNVAVSGEALVLPWQGGYSFYYANTEGANGRYFLQSSIVAGAAVGNPTQSLAVRGYLEGVRAGAVRGPEDDRIRYGAVNDYWFDRATREIADDPPRWLGLMLRKALELTSDREIFNFEDYTVQRERSLLLRLLPGRFGWLWPMALGSLAVLWNLGRGRRRLAGGLWLYAALLGGAIGLYYTSGRMRMPLMFPAVLLGAAGLALAVEHARAKAWPRFGAWAALVVVGLAMSWGDWNGVRSENMRFAEFERLSNASYRLGEYENALAFAEDVERERPGYPTAPQLRAQALYGLGQFDGAAAAYRDAAERMPTNPGPHVNLGVIALYERGAPAEAVGHFREALERDPNNGKAAGLAAIAQIRLGRVEAAAQLLANERPDEPLEILVARVLIARERADAAATERYAKALADRFGPGALERLSEELEALKAAKAGL
ncbi:MAG: tetratricopeptide repeat protein [Sumerlaeia bacterium]